MNAILSVGFAAEVDFVATEVSVPWSLVAIVGLAAVALIVVAVLFFGRSRTPHDR